MFKNLNEFSFLILQGKRSVSSENHACKHVSDMKNRLDDISRYVKLLTSSAEVMNKRISTIMDTIEKTNAKSTELSKPVAKNAIEERVMKRMAKKRADNDVSYLFMRVYIVSCVIYFF